MDLTTTLIVLALELIIFGVCYWRERKPIEFGKPRLLPYRLIMITMIVLFLGTLAHVVSLLTGQTVTPRNKLVK